jgi:hypothetical protein
VAVVKHGRSIHNLAHYRKAVLGERLIHLIPSSTDPSETLVFDRQEDADYAFLVIKTKWNSSETIDLDAAYAASAG